MRNKLFALALIIALIGFTTPVAVHDAKAASYTREGLPSVQVTVEISPVHTNTTQNLAQLTGRDNNTRLGIMDGHHVGGLTVGGVQHLMRVLPGCDMHVGCGGGVLRALSARVGARDAHGELLWREVKLL